MFFGKTFFYIQKSSEKKTKKKLFVNNSLCIKYEKQRMHTLLSKITEKKLYFGLVAANEQKSLASHRAKSSSLSSSSESFPT